MCREVASHSVHLVGAAYALGSVKASWNWSVSDKLEGLIRSPNAAVGALMSCLLCSWV